MKKFLMMLFSCISVFYINAQPTKIRGTVFDLSTRQAIPYANILLKGSSETTTTDTEGNFFIQTNSESDTLVISNIGYKKSEIKINSHYFNDLIITLEPYEYSLNEVVIHPGENPSWKIMRKIVDNKKNNNPEKLDAYSFETYSKVEIDISNITSDLKNEFIFKDFDFVFANIDTSAETGKTYLPIIIYESVSDFYFKKLPKLEKEVIKAIKVSGIENQSLAQYAGQMYFDINIYDNFIEIFDRKFVSPFSDFWRLTYKYYLLDSFYVNGKHQYLISFRPQRKQEMTFHGEFLVHDTTFAITKVKMRMSENVNINFFNDFIVQQESELIDSLWFLSKEELFIDFNVTDKTYGIFGKKISSRKNIDIEPEFEKNTFDVKIPESSIVLDDAKSKDSVYWEKSRHLKLEKREQNIYIMVDSIQKTKQYQIGKKIAYTWITGYFTHSWWEIGPYYTFYSKNSIEGNRIKFGGRTSNDFSKKLMFNANIAYGFLDKNIKYTIGSTFMVSKSPFRKFVVQYKSDLEQLGLSSYAFAEDNIVTTAFGRTSYNKILPVKELKIYYKHEWFEGFSNTINIKHRILFPTQVIEFKNVASNKIWENLTTTEISLTFHLAYNEKFVMGEFERYSLGSEYPTFDIIVNKGFKNILESQHNYFQLIGSFDYHFDINPIGKFQINSEAGKLWGQVPFPLLKLHEGNETYIFDPYSFNMMNYYEFASEEFVSLYIEHHFNGFILNKIPLIRILKFREIIYAKGLIGRISEENYKNALFDFPSSLSDVRKPYIELGVGLENILKIIRIDAIWRISYLNNPEISHFGIRFNFQFLL
jgi:hypothetical protein